MRATRCVCAAIALIMSVTGATTSVRAEVPVDAWDLMFWAGWYEPGQDVFSGELSLGARLGKHWGRRSMLSGEFAIVRLDGDPEGRDVTGDFENRLTSFEFTYSHYFLPDKRTSFALFGGAGYANADLTGTVAVGDTETTLFGSGQDSFTVGGGAAIRANVNENFYIRPALRLKWFEQRDGDSLDGEFQIGFGLVLY